MSFLMIELIDRYPDIAFRLQFESFEPTLEIPSESVALPPALDEIEVFYIYGIGSGAHFHALKEWLAGMQERQLIVLEDDLAAMHAFLKTPLAQEIVCHPQVHIYCLSSFKEILLTLKEIATTFPSEYVACAAHVQKKRRRLRQIELALYRIATVNCALMAEALYGHKLLSNIL